MRIMNIQNNRFVRSLFYRRHIPGGLVVNVKNVNPIFVNVDGVKVLPDSRRHDNTVVLLVICRLAAAYQVNLVPFFDQGYRHFLNPYATATEYPYPLYVSGCSTRFDALFGDSGFNLGGMHNPIARTGAGASSNGPATIRAPDGIWYSVHNIQFNGSTVTAVDGHNVHPTNSQINVNDSGSFPDPADRFVSGVLSYDLIIRNRDYQLEPSDTDVVVLTPTVVFSNAPDKGPVRWYGEIPDVYWFDVATTGITPEDRLIANGVYHRAFQNGNVTDNNYQFCIREDA